jgi:hypothetical protein
VWRGGGGGARGSVLRLGYIFSIVNGNG